MNTYEFIDISNFALSRVTVKAENLTEALTRGGFGAYDECNRIAERSCKEFLLVGFKVKRTCGLVTDYLCSDVSEPSFMSVHKGLVFNCREEAERVALHLHASNPRSLETKISKSIPFVYSVVGVRG